MIKKNEEMYIQKKKNEWKKKEFLEKLDELEESVKKKDERIYNELSKPYSDGVDLTDFKKETENANDDDIKTY